MESQSVISEMKTAETYFQCCCGPSLSFDIVTYCTSSLPFFYAHSTVMVLATHTQKHNNWLKAFLKNIRPGLTTDILRYVKYELCNFKVILTLESVERILKCDH